MSSSKSSRDGLKPFQEATVAHAVARLRDPAGSRRFLVADEVGLGKTLVAQGILQDLAQTKHPFNVFYLCSSLTIANQNRDSLLEVLPVADRKSAVISVDRTTLLPWADPPENLSFALFTLTPGTLPMKGSLRGRVDERAAIWCLLREGLPDAGASLKDLEARLKLVQDVTWRSAVDARGEGKMLERIRQLARPFLAEVRTLLHLAGSSDHAVAEALSRRLHGQHQLSTIQNLRQRLGRLGLGMMKPDLVILDEFQRFFEILDRFRGSADGETRVGIVEEEAQPSDDDEDAQSLLRLLLGSRDGDAGPAILLMSATPYRPPAGGAVGADARHYDQFFQLLEFLYGARAIAEVPDLRKLFRRYGALLREAAPGSKEMLAVRDDIQSRLFRVMARTERASLLAATADRSAPTPHPVPLQPDDVRIYRHLWDAASDEDRSAATPYWSSIPYPLQMLDRGYLLRQRAKPMRLDAEAASRLVLQENQIRHYQTLVPPHPRMRGLLSKLSEPLLGLPWLPPSIPWWPLGSPFKEAVHAASQAGGLSKTLIFSRFRAVPRAIASLVSFEAERRVYAAAQYKRYDYRARRPGGRDVGPEPEPGLEALPAPSFNWQSRQLGTGERSQDHALLALFVPAPRLGELGNPQRIDGFAQGDLLQSDALAFVEAAVRSAVETRFAGKIEISDGRRTGQAWRALVRLERANEATWHFFRDALKGWSDQSKNSVARAAVRAWLDEAQASQYSNVAITTGDIEELAELALTGPGIVLHRAAQRVFRASGDASSRLRRSVDIALGALRSYLDEPEFHLTLAVRDRALPNHPQAVRRAIWQGNLEAVFDEYFAVHAGLGSREVDPGRESKALDALEQALLIRVSTIRVQTLEGSDSLGLRCHVAMPFGLSPDKDQRRTEDGEEARPDALRHAFNSPFRPFVLATTSIGQEGLDFHVYCDQLVHWDLPASPVDLEQRDGRINRYGSLAIRKALAEQATSSPVPTKGSPWLVMTRALSETCGGMSPWWGTQGAAIRRSVFLPPLAKQEEELSRLLARLSHYRLAIGQSDPEQLLRTLHRRIEGADTEEARTALHVWLREARIDLAPIRRLPVSDA